MEGIVLEKYFVQQNLVTKCFHKSNTSHDVFHSFMFDDRKQ